MSPKTKAEKLIEAHMAYSEVGFTNDLSAMTIVRTAKHCALITVNVILDEWNKEDGRTAKQKYWREVKNEIEKY